MHISRRGTPMTINKSLNKERSLLGINLSVWVWIILASALAFAVGFYLLSTVFFALLVLGCKLATMQNPKFFHLWLHSLEQKSYYDPRKR